MDDDRLLSYLAARIRDVESRLQDLPVLISHEGDPNGVVTAREATLCWDLTNHRLYMNVSSPEGTLWYELGAGGAPIGDMTKAVYDNDDNGIVDAAEMLDDGSGNQATAAEVRTHINDADKHREIDDSSTGVTDLWSANKINTELSGKADVGHTHTESDITDLEHDAVKLQGRVLSVAVPDDGDALVWNDGAAQWEPEDVRELEHIGSPTYSSIQDWLNTTQSAGKLTGGGISDNGDGTVTVAAGTGFIKTTDSDIGVTKFLDWAEDTSVSLTDDSINYIYVEYNAGSPQVVSSTSRPTDRNTNILLGQVYRDGTDLHITTAGQVVSNYASKTFWKDIEVNGKFQRVSGFIISEKADRKFAVSSGLTYAGLTKITLPAFDSSSGHTFTAVYQDGAGGWTFSPGQTQIDNLHYDDGSGTLAELSDPQGWWSFFGVHWIYEDTDGHVFVVYGRDDYRLDDAVNAQPPSSLPDLLVEIGLLVGKIVIEKNASSFETIESPFDIAFTPSVIVYHNELAGIEGGTYHLEQADYDALTDANAQLAELQTDGSPTFAGLDITGLTDGYVPYVGAGEFADSPIYTDGTCIEVAASATDLAINLRFNQFTVNLTANNNTSSFPRVVSNHLALNVATGKTAGGVQTVNESRVSKRGSGVLSWATCFQSLVDHTDGTISKFYAFQANQYGAIAAPIGDYVAFHQPELTFSGDGAITNYYGVKIDDPNAKNYFAGSVGIGTTSLGAVLSINQSSGTGAKPVLLLDQADVSEEFIRFIGAAASGNLTRSLVAAGDVTTATIAGYLRVYVRDDGNQITDQAYYVPVYTLS